MAKKTKATEFQNEPQVLVESLLHPEMTKAFATSSQNFLDRVQFLRRKLEGKFERYSDDDGVTSRQRWNPPEYFNCCHFRSQLRLTYEAWDIARRLNLELDTFNGETLLKLVHLFEEMSSEQRKDSGVPAPTELTGSCFKFEHEVDRFALLMAIKHPSKTTVETQRNTRGPRNSYRDSQWYDWKHVEGMTDAKIRDRWNAANPLQTISDAATKKAGRELVKKAIERMKKTKQSGDK